MPRRPWYKCDRCGWEGDGTEGYGTHGCQPRFPVPDTIANPEVYWKAVAAEMATWKPVEDDDIPAPPTFL